jgi:hypothetical protein
MSLEEGIRLSKMTMKDLREMSVDERIRISLKYPDLIHSVVSKSGEIDSDGPESKDDH